METKIETTVENVNLKEYTTEQMKKHITQHNQYVKKQQELQQLLKLPEDLKLPEELKKLGVKLFGSEIAMLGQNRMALEVHLCHVVKGLELGVLTIPNVNYEIEEIPCPSGEDHNHRIIKLWIDDQKTVLIDMIFIGTHGDEADA